MRVLLLLTLRACSTTYTGYDGQLFCGVDLHDEGSVKTGFGKVSSCHDSPGWDSACSLQECKEHCDNFGSPNQQIPNYPGSEYGCQSFAFSALRRSIATGNTENMGECVLMPMCGNADCTKRDYTDSYGTSWTTYTKDGSDCSVGDANHCETLCDSGQYPWARQCSEPAGCRVEEDEGTVEEDEGGEGCGVSHVEEVDCPGPDCKLFCRSEGSGRRKAYIACHHVLPLIIAGTTSAGIAWLAGGRQEHVSGVKGSNSK